MTPVEQAAEVYQREPCARPFHVDLELHLLHGWVISTPDFFLMARPVSALAHPALIVNPAFNSFVGINCWHVYLCAGDWRQALRVGIEAAGAFPYVSFERRNRLRVHRLRALIGGV